MARYVLVHGAFGGAWSWGEVAGSLAAAGHEVTAVDLPGAGEDPTPAAEVTLAKCAARVCEALDAAEEPAILAGHSMGGVIITQAAAMRPERVALLVYVAAFMPSDGQSLIDLTRLPEGAGDQVQANIVVEGDPPIATMPDIAARGVLMARCTPEQVAYAFERSRPQAVAPFATPVAIPEGVLDGIPRVYVHTTEDRAIPPALQLRMIREHPCVEVVELRTDHSPAFSATVDLTAALDRCAELVAL